MMKQKWSIDDEGIQNNDTKIKYEDIQEARLQRECSPGICDGCISIKAQGRVYSLLYINRDREEAHKALQYINEHYGSVEERQKRSEKKEKVKKNLGYGSKGDYQMNEINAMKENANKALKLAKDFNTLMTVFLVIIMFFCGALLIMSFMPYSEVSFVAVIIMMICSAVSYGSVRLGIYIVELLAYANLVKVSEVLSEE